MKFAYLPDRRIDITEYEESMAGEITCAEGHPVIAKRGEHKAHHFAHKSACTCSASDNKGEWHTVWQDRASLDAQEIRLTEGSKLHIADCLVEETATVVEYQHSPMEEKVMRERESFYTAKGYHLVWVFDTYKWEYTVTKRTGSTVQLRYRLGPKFPMYGAYTGKVTKILDFGKRDLFVVTKQSGSTLTGTVLSLEDFDRKYLGTKAVGEEYRPFHHPL